MELINRLLLETAAFVSSNYFHQNIEIINNYLILLKNNMIEKSQLL
jgi:hypothetical protein